MGGATRVGGATSGEGATEGATGFREASLDKGAVGAGGALFGKDVTAVAGAAGVGEAAGGGGDSGVWGAFTAGMRVLGDGVALGVNENFDYRENSMGGLANGQIIAVGTDGIWEAVNSQGEMFGKERFREIIKNNAGARSEVILNAVYNELSRFTRGQKSKDDITLVIIKVAR